MLPDDPQDTDEPEDPKAPGPKELGEIDPEEIDDEQSEGEEEEEEEEEEEIEFADQPLPDKGEVREALDWAFEGEDAPAEYLDRCAEHAMLVQDANRRMNLTKIVEPKDIAAKHYLDSWRATRLLPLMGRSVLDIGSGAGYPGIPLAFAEPNTRVVLIEATRKKAEFIGECIEKIGIPNATAEWGRAEEYLIRNHFDVVILRALSSVRENVRLLRKVRHSLKDLVMLKGPSWSREVRAGERESERLGFRLDTVWEHKLPDDMGDRAVLVYRAPGGAGM